MRTEGDIDKGEQAAAKQLLGLKTPSPSPSPQLNHQLSQEDQSKRMHPMIMLLRDNGNASKTQAHWSHFRGKLSFDVAIGGIIYPHVALDVSTLSCELPQFARRMANGSYTVATLSELRETCKLSPKALLTEVRAAVALRTTEDWLFYGRSPSLLPPDYFQLRPNALSLSPIASSGAPLLSSDTA